LASYVAGNVTAVAPNPTKPNQFAFANFNSGTSKYKLYKGNTSLDIATSTLLTTNSYDGIDGVQFTPDGLYVIFKADAGSGFKLYRVAVGGGVPTVLDSGVFEFSVNPVVGTNLVAYAKDSGTSSDVYTVDYLTANKVQVTNLGIETFSPNWSRDGANIVFGHSPDPFNENIHLFNVTYPGGTVTEVTPASTFNEAFGFYNEDMTKVAVLRVGGSGVLLDSYDIGSTSFTTVVDNTSLGSTCYWTDSNGRSVSANIPSFQFGSHRRRSR